jgi:hypothetical protein
MKSESLEFWEKVKEEFVSADYNLSKTGGFLCFASKTFKQVWEDKCDPSEQDNIMGLGRAFLEQGRIKLYTVPPFGITLFSPVMTSLEQSIDRYSIRHQFIEWNIKRLTI